MRLPWDADPSGGGWKDLVSRPSYIKKQSMAGHIIHDYLENDSNEYGFRKEDTYMVLVHDPSFWYFMYESHKKEVVTGWMFWLLKCVGEDNLENLRNVRNIYMAGQSRGGCLVTRMAYRMRYLAESETPLSSSEWGYLKNTQIIVGSYDGVARAKSEEMFTNMDSYEVNTDIPNSKAWISDITSILREPNIDILQVTGGQMVKVINVHGFYINTVTLDGDTLPTYQTEWINQNHEGICRYFNQQVFDWQSDWLKARIQRQVADPVITPGVDTFTRSIPVTITTSTAGASIYYTTDGSVPTEADGIPYTETFTITDTTTVKAIATKDGDRASAVVTKAYTEIIPTINAIARYEFNGDASDSSGNENHGTVYEAVLTTDRHGNADSAYLFNGGTAINCPDDFIDCGNSESIKAIDTEITITAWIKPHVLGRRVMGRNGNERQGGWALYLDVNGYYRFTFSDGTGGHPVNSSVQVTAGEWHYIACTYSKVSGELTISVDGVEDMVSGFHDGVFNYVDIPWPQCEHLEIGRYWARGWSYFNGIIDDVVIYDQALTAEQIESLK